MDEEEQSPIEVVRAAIAALNRGDVEAALGYCADDVVVWSAGRELAGQELRGKDALRAVLEFGEACWPDTWSAVRTIIADGNQVAVEMTTVATEQDRKIIQPMAAFFTVEDGLIVGQRSYFDLGALDRALGR
jgi:ketosteroid isomerase-like protein